MELAAIPLEAGLLLSGLVARIAGIVAMLTRNRRAKEGESTGGVLAVGVALALFANFAPLWVLLTD